VQLAWGLSNAFSSYPNAASAEERHSRFCTACFVAALAPEVQDGAISLSSRHLRVVLPILSVRRASIRPSHDFLVSSPTMSKPEDSSPMDPFSPQHQPDEGYSEDPLNPSLPDKLPASLSARPTPAELSAWLAANPNALPISLKKGTSWLRPICSPPNEWRD
jgi:hypothetical protein